MTEIISKIKSKIVFTNNIVFFLLCALGAIYFLPREKKFEYEYTKGKPWMHETLFSPFDFPIQKSENELNDEKDTILKSVKPIYAFDEYVFEKVNSDVNKLELSIVQKDQFSEILRNIYNVGVFDNFELTKQQNNGKSEIIINRNNIAEDRILSEVYTLKTAYQLLKSEVEKKIKIQGVEFADFIKVNCKLDETKTKNFAENLLRELSINKGVIISGEKIVDKGELINDETFNKLESLRTEYFNYYSKKENQLIYQFVSNATIVLILLLLFFIYLFYFERSVFMKVSNVIFILLQIIVIMGLTKLCRLYDIDFYGIPVVAVAILTSIFINMRVSFSLFTMLVLLVSFSLPNPFEFVVVQMVAGVVAILTINNLFQRSQFFLSIFYVIMSYFVVYFAFELMRTGNIYEVNYMRYFYFLANSLFLMFSYPLIYIVEKSFGFLSNISLMELSDTNQPLLRNLAERAPGTFQHSMQVANLAQEVAYKVNANPLLIRAGALYHDIGKMVTPHMFIENQGGDPNVHDNIPPEKSAELIINHVLAGAEQAKKKKVPKQIIDFILTHHGDRKLIFFLQKYKELNPDTDIDEKIFQYKGKRPFTKETAVLMMADSVEAASRSIKKINSEKIEQVVNTIIDKQISDKQFTNVDLSFKDIEVIKSVFIQKLKDIYHERIEYPTED
jgi:putative nucleotidyltransferase with HDIG domain